MSDEMKLRKKDIFYREQRVKWSKLVIGLLILGIIMSVVGFFVPFTTLQSREKYGGSDVVMGSDTNTSLFISAFNETGVYLEFVNYLVWPLFALVLCIFCKKFNKLFTSIALMAMGAVTLVQETVLFFGDVSYTSADLLAQGYVKNGFCRWLLDTPEKLIHKTLFPNAGLILWWCFSLLMIALGLYVLFIRLRCTNLAPRISLAPAAAPAQEQGGEGFTVTSPDAAASEEQPLLRVEHLCQYFGFTKAVDDVSFDIRKGEVFGLVGESGCGKTTTGRSIIKLYDITSGTIYFNGIRIGAGTKSYKDAIADAKAAYKQKVTDDPANKAQYKAELDDFVAEQKLLIREAAYDQKYCDAEYQFAQAAKVREEYAPRLAAAKPEELDALKAEYADKLRKAENTRLITKIQMIFQDPSASLDPRMTVREIISEGLIIQGERDKQVLENAVFEMLEKVGLVREHAGRYQHEFSGGQRQRIGIARSVVMKPEMIIADEPVSALDVSIQAQVINLLNDLRHELGLTIMFIAHDLSVVKYFSDRIGVMYYGKMVELASSDELFLNPLHPYTRSLLSAIPLPDPEYEKERVRIEYKPLAEHDYSVDKPTMREVKPGHFVYCNEAEYQKYMSILK